jgi:hypothetical protein
MILKLKKFDKIKSTVNIKNALKELVRYLIEIKIFLLKTNYRDIL